MFHAGDLQSGISRAIQEAKLVVCFVRDQSEESRVWEEQWLRDEKLAVPLIDKAVVLRLEAGSQEAGFLSAFCPIAKTPALVVIHNGQLKLYLTGGISRDDFVSRLGNVLDPDTVAATPSIPLAGQSAQVPEEPVATRRPPVPTAEDDPYDDVQAAPNPAQVLEASSEAALAQTVPTASSELPTLQATAPPSAPVSSTPPTTTPRTIQEPSVQPQPTSAQTSTPVSEKAAGKRRAVEQDTSTNANAAKNDNTRQTNYAAQQRLRERAHREELNRILERVEADKRARKDREREAKARREAELRDIANAGASPDSNTAPAPRAPTSPSRSSLTAAAASRSGKDITLRIRLLDGSQLREPFPPTATLASDVRPRVDWALSPPSSSSSSPKPPAYTFKLLLAPPPNRLLSARDEATPLAELPDVAPSATLVVVPVSGGVAAYAGGGGGGGLGGVVSAVLGVVLGLWGVVLAVVRALAGPLVRVGGGGGGRGAGATEGGRGRQGKGSSADSGSGSTLGSGTGREKGNGNGASGIRIRTLNDQREAQNEYYNGNSLDFEPKEEEDKGK